MARPEEVLHIIQVQETGKKRKKKKRKIVFSFHP
jgi:hypothetical protein